MLRQNEGTLDRDIRIVLAALLGLLTLFAPVGIGWQIVLGMLAILLFVTAASGVCFFYIPLRINTRDGPPKQVAAKK